MVKRKSDGTETNVSVSADRTGCLSSLLSGLRRWFCKPQILSSNPLGPEIGLPTGVDKGNPQDVNA